MSDWLKLLAEMSLDNLFVVAGLIFLGIAVVAEITGKIHPGPTRTVMSGGLSACLMAGGLWIHSGRLGQTDQRADSMTTPPTSSNEDQHIIVGLEYFSGTWKNTDTQTKGITIIGVRTRDNSVWMHAWRKCSPSDCDWGEVPAKAFGSDVSADVANDTQTVSALFKTSFSETSITLRATGEAGLLDVQTYTRFTDNSGRSSYWATYLFRK
jgi:hypothetical protein